MILISRLFQKQLEKIGSVNMSDIIREISKHEKGLGNFVVLFESDTMEMLKGYLLSKKMRIMVAFARDNKNYFPFLLPRKETRNGYNITKSDEEYLMNELEKHIICIKNGEYRKIEF